LKIFNEFSNRSINFLKLQKETGIDYNKDTYDGGLHLNLTGAEKLSDYFGEILKDKYKVEDRRNEEKLKKVWQKKIDFYNNMRESQYKELEEYGCIKSVGGNAAEN
jgi:hypothetical protein